MAASKNKTQPPATLQDFPVIGIGASAGGLDAFKRLLKAIPKNSGMAYVLVQHLDPTHESLLPEILARVTNIPVNEITDDIHLAPDHIYVIPSNKILTTFDGVLKLAMREGKIKNAAIDVFFTSLATVHKELAVGIVLSGTGSDGTLGLKAIKAHGGITFAQDQASAAYGDMPQNAVNAETVDFILAPEDIPMKLMEIAFTSVGDKTQDEEYPKEDETVFKEILSLLHQRTGVDFTYYKQSTIRRRIARRMAVGKKGKLTDYLKILHGDKVEQDVLFQDLLIPVTSFFRDPNTFSELCKAVFPVLFSNKSVEEPIRVWIAGCSTGEEVFSIAICLSEFLGGISANRDIQIFATDISEIAIKKARTAIYTKANVQMLSEKRLSTYFTTVDGGYQVNKSIRNMCVFAIHNFLKDPPFARIDLISCRNVLIYLDSFLQKKTLTTFHYALKKDGFLLLGKSETTSAVSELFTPFMRNDKIYSPKLVPGRFAYFPNERKAEMLRKKETQLLKAEILQTDFRKTAEAILLSKHTPASVVVNEQMDIVHFHGSISPFLGSPPGKPTFNLLKMAREGLGFELRNALHKAKSTRASFIREGIPTWNNGNEQLVNIEVIPLTNVVEPHYLIVFTKTLVAANLSGKGAGIANDEVHSRIQQLENELAQTREDMRSITEEQEAANEELQSSSEELQSSSEEMQSLNEELETSKEELQSSNEELVILNQELLDKQDQLNISRLYSEAIVTSIREPLIILDKNLRIKTANISFYKKFNLTEQETEDKLLYELQDHRWDNEVLRSLLEQILTKKTKVEDFEVILILPVIGERTLLLNARKIVNEITAEQLILLAIEDITERRIVEQKLQTFSDELEDKVEERTADLLQTNMQLQQFAHAASHDLQEPLRKILTFSKRLQEKHTDEFSANTKTYLDKIEAASTRMSKLIQDLLDYAHLINYEKLFAPTNLDDALKNIINDFELLIEQKDAQIISDTLPVIEAIPLQINQLFYNLISNALKFSKADVPPVIQVSSRILSPKEIEKYPGLNKQVAYCEIVFKDNGIGFEQKYAEQIFTIFQRLNLSTQYKGTGIGLALCKKIVETHHGEIFTEARENEGAAFHIILPTQQVKDEW